MEKETSCINSRAILDYLKHRQVDCSAVCRGLDPEIDSLKDPENFLRDPDNWISCGVISKLYRRAATILNDAEVAYKIGRYTSENISLGYVQRIVIKSFWSISRLSPPGIHRQVFYSVPLPGGFAPYTTAISKSPC